MRKRKKIRRQRNRWRRIFLKNIWQKFLKCLYSQAKVGTKNE